MTLKLKQKELWKEIIKLKEVYKKITGYSKSNSPVPSNLNLFELNQFNVSFDTIDFSKEIADERMELNGSKNVNEC